MLRQHKLGEADRIVTLLTRDHGLVRAVAKGVRRTRSKFGARLEPFAHIDAQLHPGRNLDIVTQVVSIDAFATDIVNDYGRYTCGCAMLETAERLAGEERAPAPACTGSRWARCGRSPTDVVLATCCWTPICCVPWVSPAGRRR
ncbi:DNA repair protein RecO [Mycobacterium kansasii 732]|nr:DNA repair protein RecO [Mycobacterium kansasii 732]